MERERVNTARWDDKNERWVIKVQRDGDRRSFYSSVPGRKGQTEANRKADAWLKSQSDGERRRRVEDVYKEYALYRARLVAEKRKEPLPDSIDGLSQRDYGTHASDINYIKNWLVKGREKRWFDTINDAVVQEILDRAAAKRLSKKTIQRIRGAISTLVKFARRRKYTTYRLDEVSVPENARLKGKNILQPDALRILFTSDQTIYYGKVCKDRYIYAFRFQVVTGLRPGELIGLRWSDIPGDGTARIRRAINTDGDISEGKNQNSIRDIVLPPLAIAQLEAQRQISGDKEYVFDIPTQRYYYNAFTRYLEHNKIEHITPYELRHTFVSVIQSLPEASIKLLVGHSKAMDTMTYTHAVDGYAQKTSSDINRIFDEILAKK